MFTGVVVAGVVSAPGMSLAAGSPSLSLNGGFASVKTANGLTWRMGASWYGGTLEIALWRTDTRGGEAREDHLWEFAVPTSTLKFDATTGTGSLKTYKPISPVATIDLVFKATSSKRAACTRGSETIYGGTLNGDLVLVTGLKGGGTVGGTALTFRANPQLTSDSGCRTPALDPCVAQVRIGAGDGHAAFEGLSDNVSGKPIDLVLVARATIYYFKVSTFAVRLDIAVQEAAPATYDTRTKVLRLTTSTSGLVTGSATLSGGKVSRRTTSCKYSGKKYTETESWDSNARYASPRGHPISAKMSLGGTLTVPSPSRSGFYDIVTVEPS